MVFDDPEIVPVMHICKCQNFGFKQSKDCVCFRSNWADPSGSGKDPGAKKTIPQVHVDYAASEEEGSEDLEDEDYYESDDDDLYEEDIGESIHFEDVRHSS